MLKQSPGSKIFSLLQTAHTGSTAHTVLLVNGYWGSLPVVKWPVREVYHSSTSRAEIKNEWSYTSTPLYAFIVWTGKTLGFTYFTVKIMPKTNTRQINEQNVIPR